MKRIILTAVLAMFSVVAFAQKREIRNAGKAINDGNFQEAKNLLQQAESEVSGAREKVQADYYFYKGKAYLATADETVPAEDLYMAAEAFQKARELGHEDADPELIWVRNALVNNAARDQESSDFTAATEKLYHAYELNKQDTINLYYAASSAVSDQDFDTALEYYLELRDLGYDGGGMQYSAVSKETGEVEYMTQEQRDLMIKVGDYTNPQDHVVESKKGEITKNIALIYNEQGEKEKALQAMADAKAENPDDVNLLINEADLYMEMGDQERYDELMEEILEKDPDNPLVFFKLGYATAEAGDIDQAIEYYERALEIDPEFMEARINIAYTMLDKRIPLTEELNNLGMSEEENKRYEELEEEILDIYRESLHHLEIAFEQDPTQLETAKTMRNFYSLLEEEEKEQEMSQIVAELEANAGQ